MALDPATYAKDLARRIDARVKAAAALLQAEHKRDLSKSFPRASQPGEYPRFRTLNLRDSVGVTQVRQGIYRVGYFSGAWYILVLAARKRLTVVDTAARLKDRLMRIIRGG